MIKAVNSIEQKQKYIIQRKKMSLSINEWGEEECEINISSLKKLLDIFKSVGAISYYETANTGTTYYIDIYYYAVNDTLSSGINLDGIKDDIIY